MPGKAKHLMDQANQSSVIDQSLRLATTYYQSGRVKEAEDVCHQILAVVPRHPDVLHMLGVVAAQAERFEEAVSFFSKAIKAKKDEPLFYYHLGLALQKLGRTEDASEKYKKALILKPDYAEACLNIGNILKIQGKDNYAETHYRRALSIRKDYIEALYNLGVILQERGTLDEALDCYSRAASLKPAYAEAHLNIGAILYRQGRLDEAAEKYQRIIDFKPDCAEAHNNLGVVRQKQGRVADTLKCYEQAIILKPDYSEAHYNLAVALQDLDMLPQAEARYRQAIVLQPEHAAAHYNLGIVLQKQEKLDEAIDALERAVNLRPGFPDALSELVHRLYHACAWDKIDPYQQALLEMVRKGDEGGSPFAFLGIPGATAADQFLCAKSFCKSIEKQSWPMFQHRADENKGRISIGYLSADFHSHATAYLMAELFEKHDRSRFRVLGYSYGPDDGSPMRKRLMAAFDDFIDLRALTDEEAARKINSAGVDILIDLKGGYTGSARMGISACKPAPVQVNYLGYPGTMGASFMDYIVADPFIIPVDQQPFYSEKVAYMPYCYQPNDTARSISDVTPPRTACGLPEKGFVFCCFNANYKITPEMFDIWMRLLKAVPDSVLWLFKSNSTVEGNLRREAAKRGVEPDRLVFAPKMILSEHLARHRLADLFLDTLPVNAHTTASDALWAGLPVVTCAGTTFAGRVAGSLLKAAGLPELITYSLADYEALALRLAQSPERLREIRKKLEETRLKTPLFDIDKYVKDIESVYQVMWSIWRAKEPPRSFSINRETK